MILASKHIKENNDTIHDELIYKFIEKGNLHGGRVLRWHAPYMPLLVHCCFTLLFLVTCFSLF